jgi:hypothetical protein
MNPTDALETRFHERVLQVYEQAESACAYTATRFRNRVIDPGGLQAATALLGSQAYSEGLTRLREKRRLDISMEATVL